MAVLVLLTIMHSENVVFATKVIIFPVEGDQVDGLQRLDRVGVHRTKNNPAIIVAIRVTVQIALDIGMAYEVDHTSRVYPLLAHSWVTNQALQALSIAPA